MAVTPDEYCRGLEAHLTRRNDGHLIRVVGPAFEMVCGWAEQGVPFKIACHGIDRTVERYYAKGPRRRPVRIEYCEADVLDAFDRWRRAVGVRSAGEAGGAAPKREGLATIIRRALSRLTAARGAGAAEGRIPDESLDEFVRTLDRLASRAERARGAVRAAIVAELDRLDTSLLEAARAAATADMLAGLEWQAEEDLAPFRDRMPVEAWRRARSAAVNELLRAHAGLPMLAGHGASDEDSGAGASLVEDRD